MKKCVCLTLFLVSLYQFAIGQDLPSKEIRSGYYSFLGAEILAKHKSQMLPIAFANKKGVFVDTAKGIKRRPWSVTCSAMPEVSISNTLVHVESIEYSFLFLKSSSQEEGAYSAIENKDREIDFKIAAIDRHSANSADKIEQLELERDEYEDDIQDMILEGRFDVEGHADSISMKLHLIAPVDIEDAFCAVIVGHHTIDGQSQRFAIGIQKLGHLMQNIPETTEFTVILGEGDYSKPSVDLFVYAGSGSPIATTASRELKELSAEELEKEQPR